MPLPSTRVKKTPEERAEERKQHKKDYYFKNRNYKNLNFSKDIVKMFSNPLEVV